MNLEIVIEQKAVDEIAEAAKWYSEKSFIASKIFEKRKRKFLLLQFYTTKEIMILLKQD